MGDAVMRGWCRYSVLGFVLAWTSVAPTPVLAQGTGSTPRISGPDAASSTAGHRLNFTLSPVEGYDTGVPEGLQGQFGSNELQTSGYSTWLMADADYQWKRPAASFRVTGSSAIKYYDRLDEVKSLSHSASLGFSLGVPQSTTFRLDQDASYSPSYLYRLFPTASPLDVNAPPDAAPDYRVDEAPSYSYSTRATLAHGERRRGRVSATAEFDATDFHGDFDAQRQRPDLRVYGGQAQYEHGLARNVIVSTGYQYRAGEFGYGGQTTEQLVSFGVRYSRALSRTRRADFRVNVSPSRLSIPASADHVSVTGDVYRVSGDASVSYQLLRTWQAGANVRRRLEYIASIGEPVYADGVGVNVVGFVTQGTNVSFSAAYSSGESALNRNALTFDSYTADARVQRSLTRTLAVYGEYLYYFYDLTGASRLPRGVPPRFERNSVRAGVTLWIQALGR